MGPKFQVICDKCLRTEAAREGQGLPSGTCGRCGGTWLGPYVVADRFTRPERLQLIVSEEYLAAYGADAQPA